MQGLLPTVLALAVLALAGMLAVVLLRRSASDDAGRANLDAIERARSGLSQELRGGDSALQTAVTQTLGSLGGQVGHQIGEARREQSEALAEHRRLLTETSAHQSEELQATRTELRDRLETSKESEARVLQEFGDGVQRELTTARQEQKSTLEANTSTLVTALEGHGRNLTEATGSLQKELGLIREAQALAAQELGRQVAEQVEILRKGNEEKLESIRTTVDEKLHATLENRLGESFKLVSERLELLHKGLGEMQALAGGVGDLTRVLSNVKNRGTFGEIQLERLLTDFLTPEQYSRNVATVPGSSERVEFAIHLPGGEDGGEHRLLPIDSKFPIEDYQRLLEASEAGDAKGAQDARKALRTRVLQEAAAIRAKYLAPPATADYCLLFLPSEGLYAEVLSIPGIQDDLRRQHVIAVGPTTLQAALASFQLGLRNLAIQKRSAEVWRVLGAVKTEFGKFGDALGAVGKKLQEAQNKLDDVSRRSRAMKRSLATAHELPEAEAARLLENGDGESVPDGDLVLPEA